MKFSRVQTRALGVVRAWFIRGRVDQLRVPLWGDGGVLGMPLPAVPEERSP